MNERDTEQSMEDILASIRRIIGKTGDAQSPVEPGRDTGTRPPLTVPETAGRPNAASVAAPAPAGRPATSPPAVDPEPRPTPASGTDTMPTDAEMPLPATEGHGGDSEERTDPGLISQERAQAAAQMFSELGATLAAHQNESSPGTPGITVEQLVREMLRPTLKAWLDEHLPVLVERLVREEISRLSGR